MSKLRIKVSLGKTLIVYLALLGLISAAASNLDCSADDECRSKLNSYYECSKSRCIRRNYTYGAGEIFGLIVIVIISTITNAGGVGAGTVVVPAYSAFFGFVSSDAVHLSRITIFAGALVNFLLNWNRRDPTNKDRLLINYNIAAIMIPLHLAGAEVGVLLNKFLPSILVTIILFCFLLLSTFKTYERSKEESKKESHAVVKSSVQEFTNAFGPGQSELSRFNKDGAEDQGSDKDQADIDDQAYDQEKGKQSDTMISPNRSPDDSGPLSLGQQESNSNGIEDEENKYNVSSEARHRDLKSSVKPQTSINSNGYSVENFYTVKFETVKTESLVREQYLNFIIMVSAFSIILISALTRGGEGRPSIFGIETCSKLTWKIIYVSQFLCSALAYYAYSHNKKELERQSRETMTMTQDRNVRGRLILASYLTGVASGVVGVGGGMVLSIYMLSQGMDVSVSGALSIFAILFSSSSTTVQSVIAGGIHLRHAYAVMGMSLIGAVIGNCCLKEVIKRLNKPSIILWILLVVLGIASVVVPYQALAAIVQHPASSFSFGRFC